jgi:hypothetical protein
MGTAGAAAACLFEDEAEEHPARSAARKSQLNRIAFHDATLSMKSCTARMNNRGMLRAVAACSTLFGAALLLVAASGAGVRWKVPANWKSEAQRPMRLDTYTVAPGAECGVYYFGAGQGGSVEANVDRWVGQFLQADGKASKSAAKIMKRSVHELPVTTVDISGAYTGMGGPAVQAGPAVAGYRLLGAIVEGPQGSIFFKFVGPAKTIAQNRTAFDEMIASLGPMR